jgi:hypothetical protein
LNAIADPSMSKSATIMQIMEFLLPMVGNSHATITNTQSLMLASTPIIIAVWQNTVFESYKPGKINVDSCSKPMA